MKVLHVSPSFYPAVHYGGTIESGYGLCNGLAKIEGVKLRVLTTDSDGPNRIAPENMPSASEIGYGITFCKRRLMPDIAPSLFVRLWSMVKWADVVHLNAVYCSTTIPTLVICKILRRPLVWSARGALQRWQGSTKTRLKTAWEWVCNSLCDRNRVVLHVTSESERQESANKLPNTTPVIIPNGTDLPVLKPNGRNYQPNSLRLLYIGRLHPKKGIENLLRALPKLEPGVHLSICGDGDAKYRQSLESVVSQLELAGCVTFHGNVNGAAKEQHFRDADLCVVPSFTENYGNVVVEALAREVPVVASQGTPWQRLEAAGCGFWVSNEPDDLAIAIRAAGKMELPEMGRKGRVWVEHEYAWPKIAERVATLYGSLVKDFPISANSDL